MKISWLFLLLAASAAASDTTLLFQTKSYNVGPFPSDSLTKSDSTQKTGLTVTLPSPAECASNPGLGSCANNHAINQLDGFNPNPRLTLCFSGSIDLSSVTKAVFLAPVSSPKTTTTVNQLIFDPAPGTNCLYTKPDVVLNQHTQYLLTVTTALLDTAGHSVKPDPAFIACANGGTDSYCEALSDALGKNYQKTIIGASIFTTLSASDFLEKARTQINSFWTPELVIPAGFPWVFPLSNISTMTWNIDAGPIPSQVIPTSLAGVDSVAFGLFLSPKYLVAPAGTAGTIPYTPTNEPISSPVTYDAVSFHVYLPPAKMMPAGGFPVVIYGHGLGDSQFGAPTYMASTLAKAGIATVAIEITGHGFGPKSTVQIVDKQNNKTTLITPGRGVPLNGSPIIGPTDGCIANGPIAIRDCLRQTTVDLMAFTRTLNDFQGFGLGLNPGKVYFVGQSLGSLYGTMFHALEPRNRAALINGGGGSQTDIARLAPTARPIGDEFLAYTNPLLFNVPPAPPQGVYRIFFPLDAFNDNYPFRDNPETNNIPRAIPIQAAFEEAEWIVMSGDALSYGPLLQGKPTAFQFGIGDLEVPNPTESALVRAARGQASTWILDFPIAVSFDPTLAGLTMPPSAPFPILPHRILSNPTIVDIPNENSIAQAEQQQAAVFFSSDGKSLVNPNGFLQGLFAGVPLFSQPPPLVNCLHFFQIPIPDACKDTGR